MQALESYVAGAFTSGDPGKAATLVNPATEAPLATSSTAGLDFGRALAHAREVGSPALRALTFAERGALLRGLSKALHAERDRLLDVGMANGGTTRSDTKFDVDGAIGTLAAYADLGEALGATKVLVDGESVQLGRSPRLHGLHVRTTRTGVAVHVNAFNFPAWGLCEKAATAWLAGMPVVSKPGTSTALLAEHVAKVIVKTGLLPEGAFGFVAGSPGDLLSHLRGEDVLAFTGSSGTAATLRRLPAVAELGARLNVEADSLNVAVLGPDVELGSEVENLFLADVARDVTQKTGQKCTAIRRVYVPKERLDEIVEALAERLGRVKVGDPSVEGVGMGPVATAQQLADVRTGIARFAEVAKLVVGGAGPVAAEGVDAGKGYFVAPTLFVHATPAPGDVVHTHEIFGPAVTVMPYDGTADGAARLVNAGGGGLVASVYADDKAFLAGVVLGVAPFQGRVVVGSSKVATQALPPGMALPQLLHGGPGRAGGGEELGGARGLELYLQRTALQGDRALLAAIAGTKGE